MLRAPTSSAARSQPLGIAAGEDDVGALGPGASGGLEPDAGAAADHDDGLAEQFRFAANGTTGGFGGHDSSDVVSATDHRVAAG